MFTDGVGSLFVSDGKTILVNRQWAKMLFARKPIPHEEISIRCILTRREADARVVEQFGQRADGCYYRIAFLDPGANIRKIEFPPLISWDEACGRGVLEWDGCYILSGQAAAECH